MKSNRRGFTLVELLVVIAIIGILAAIVIASLGSAKGKGRDARRQSDLKQIQLALELYNDVNSSYPAVSSASGVTVTTSVPAGVSGTYISVIPVDPVNTDSHVYTYQSTNGSGAACSTAPCGGYVLKAVLESSTVSGGVTGTVAGVNCDVTNAYCVSN